MKQEDFYAAETRSDFFVSVTRKKLWKIQLDMLEALAGVCGKHGLRYFASNGTLLGAVRHGGFVPWDDDMDIVMPREDFEKLNEIAAHEFRPPYFFQTTLTDTGYYRNYARLRNSETTGICRPDRGNACNNGVFIDIFPLDGCSDAPFVRAARHIRAVFYDKVAWNLVYYKAGAAHTLKGRLFHACVRLLFKRTNHRAVFMKMERLRAARPFSRARKVSVITHGNNAYVWDKRCFDEAVFLEFEYTRIPVPRGYLAILESLYGDFRQLPPPEERGKRHSTFFDTDKPYTEYLDLTREEFEAKINNF